MKTLVKLNKNREPISIFTLYREILESTLPPDCIEMEGISTIPAETILRQWRFRDGKFVDVGPPKYDYLEWDCAVNDWVDRRTKENEWSIVRYKRDQGLLSSDWTQLPDVPLATKEAWAVYRQALRDITEQVDPFNIVWPAPPQ